MKPETRHALQTNFTAFVYKVFRERHGKPLGECPYVQYLCHEARHIAGGAPDKLMVNLPPRSLKTHIFSICLALWEIAQRPENKIFIFTSSDALTRDISDAIVSCLKSTWFKDLYGKRLPEGRFNKTDFPTRQGGRLVVVRITGNYTGRGADLIICDDVIEIKHARNLRKQERVWQIFETAVVSRLNNEKLSRLVVANHRTHKSDLTGYLLKTAKEDWRHCALPFVAPENEVYDIENTQWLRKKGDVLVSELFSKRGVARRLASRNAGMLYQQGRDPSLTVSLERGDFLLVDPASLPSGQVVLSIDPGQSSGRRNAFSTITAWRYISSSQHVLIDVWRRQCDFDDLCDGYLELYRRYRPSAVLIEATALGPALLQFARAKRHFGVHEIRLDSRSKMQRLAAVLDMFRTGAVQLDMYGPWLEEYLEELLEVPDGQFDDQLDATTQYLAWISKNLLQPRPETVRAAVAPRRSPNDFWRQHFKF